MNKNVKWPLHILEIWTWARSWLVGVGQHFSKSGLRSGSGPGQNSIRTPLHFVFQAHSYHSDLRAVCVAYTHTHAGAWTSVYRLFFKTKHIATSDILDKPWLSCSRIMSPVSPRKRKVSPFRRSLSPPEELAAYSKNQTAADFWMNEYKTAFPKTYHCWLSGIWTWM